MLKYNLVENLKFGFTALDELPTCVKRRLLHAWQAKETKAISVVFAKNFVYGKSKIIVATVIMLRRFWFGRIC